MSKSHITERFACTRAAMRQEAERVIARCRKLASFSEESGSTTRTFLSPPIRDCHIQLTHWLEPLGANVRVDAAGNLRALYPSARGNAPTLIIGSHLDTVPNAGAFDGALGVVLGVALLEMLDGEALRFGIEIVGFSEEEGIRFGLPFIGSRALVGELGADALALTDKNGVSVRDSIAHFGLNADLLPEDKLKSDVLGYVEFHIEQGPVLDELHLPLAVVETIAGQSRLELTFIGGANHAGTTPMHLRRDAVAGAAEWITAVERQAQLTPGLVATVGNIKAKPGVTNVIAGEVKLSLDVRHPDDDVRATAINLMAESAQAITARRLLGLQRSTLFNQPSVRMDPDLTASVEQAVRRTGCKPYRMASGAGHDAMVLAEKIPAAMIFLRSPGGVSHSPEETVKPGDVESAIEAGLNLLQILNSSLVLDYSSAVSA